MTVELARLGAITLFVTDLPVARRWYTETFGRPVVYEDDVSVVLGFEHVLVNLLQRSEADELIAPHPVGGQGDGARSQLTIWVDDVDDACDQFAAQGIVPANGPIDRPWGQRTALFADPDGHLWEIAHQISQP